MAFSMRSRSGEGKDAAMNLASGSQREKEGSKLTADLRGGGLGVRRAPSFAQVA